MIKPVKMEKGTNDCVACVAAMATGTTLEEFKKEAKLHESGRYDTQEFMLYLIKRGYMVGQSFMFETAKKFIQGHKDFDFYAKLNKDNAAIVGVWAKDKKGVHALYWDGKDLYDPDPDVLLPEFKDYEILQWNPINKITEACVYPAILLEAKKDKSNIIQLRK